MTVKRQLPLPRNQGCRKALEIWKSCRIRRHSSLDAARPVTFAGIVRAYRRDYEQSTQAEFDYYANLPSIKDAVARASRAERPDGKRHDHQTRIRDDALRQVARRLENASWSSFKSFSDVHTFLEKNIGPISGIGELMVYDTALRVGARLGFEPKVVYLHRGTRSGLRALGLNANRPFVEVSELPEELRSLRPHQLEDCLCIYKTELGLIAAKV